MWLFTVIQQNNSFTMVCGMLIHSNLERESWLRLAIPKIRPKFHRISGLEFPFQFMAVLEVIVGTTGVLNSVE